MTIDAALRFIAGDERIFLELLFERNRLKVRDHEAVKGILEKYIVTDITDENGYLIANALSEEQIDRMEQELLALYSPEHLDELFAQSVGLVEARLITIDQIMVDLELESGLMGADVFEMETVQEQVQRIADGLIRGADGDPGSDYKGSIERVTESMNRYRFDRSKGEFTLRSELMDTLERDAGAGASHSNSVAITSMAVIDRELRRVQADRAGVTHGLYSGPSDDVTRPFCDTWLGQVMSYAFWDSLANDMPEGLFDKPASIMCGGINCRHRIMPWDLQWSDGKTDLRERFARILHEELSRSYARAS